MINRTVLVGRLVKDPELKYTQSGVAVSTFTLAVNRTFAKPNEQGEVPTDFINCVVWRKLAENVANFLKKGSLAGVDGRIQTRFYDGQDGNRIYVTEVHAESVQFLEPKGSSNASQGNQSNNRGQNPSNNRRNSGQNHDSSYFDPYAGSGQIDISDDDLPF